ncbi:MAG TPA: hypothetical protein VI489_06355 [Candidatus Brocadiaceae bacterium]
MPIKQKTFLSILISSIICAVALWSLTGCFTTDKYHNKKHIDTVKKDIGSMHKDIDSVLGLDEPSPLVEEQ